MEISIKNKKNDMVVLEFGGEKCFETVHYEVSFEVRVGDIVLEGEIQERPEHVENSTIKDMEEKIKKYIEEHIRGQKAIEE